MFGLGTQELIVTFRDCRVYFRGQEIARDRKGLEQYWEFKTSVTGEDEKEFGQSKEIDKENKRNPPISSEPLENLVLITSNSRVKPRISSSKKNCGNTPACVKMN